jgi:hypothetical protein
MLALASIGKLKMVKRLPAAGQVTLNHIIAAGTCALQPRRPGSAINNALFGARRAAMRTFCGSLPQRINFK